MRLVMKFTAFIGLVTFGSFMVFADVAKTDTRVFNPVEVTADKNTNLFTQQSNPQLHCLALNIYFESRSDNLAGQFAVADVVLNRVEDPRWPSTPCDVIQQGPISKWMLEEHGKEVPIKNKCQFSWWCDGKSDNPDNETSWRKAQEIAYNIYVAQVYRGITEGATHYHATYVDPSWNKRMIVIGRIGDHIFYKSLPN